MSDNKVAIKIVVDRVTAEGFASMIVYGFYKSFEITIPYPTASSCSLEIEGLT